MLIMAGVYHPANRPANVASVRIRPFNHRSLWRFHQENLRTLDAAHGVEDGLRGVVQNIGQNDLSRSTVWTKFADEDQGSHE